MILCRSSDVTAFKTLITSLSKSFSPSGRGWDLTEAATYEKQCRRLGLKKLKQNWQLLCAPGPETPPVATEANKAIVSKRPRGQDFATKQELEDVKRERS